MQHKYNKYLALILCFAMVLALIPAASFADAGAAAASAPVAQKAKDLRKPTEKAAPEAARADTYLDTPLALGTNTYDVGEGVTVYRPFVPSEDGLYWFYSDCDYDTYGYLQDADHNELAYNDDGGNGANFSLRKSLTGGETYYLGARFYDTSLSGAIDVRVEQFDATACGDNLHWSYDAASGKLTITGYGDMWYFGQGEAPWYDVASDIKSVSLPDGLTFIGDFAFYECNGLTSVVIPEGVERIGDCAFLWCDGLERVTFPQSLIRIGNSAFESCGSLRDAVLPDALEMLDGFAFYGSGLNEVFVPASVYYIGTSAFAYCSALLPESFSVDPANANYQAEDGVLFSKDGSYLHSYLCTKPDTAYTVPSGVTEIGTYAFSGADSLCSVTLSEGVTAVDLGAFAWCYSLNSVTIADTVTEIAAYAFMEDTALTDVFYLGTEQTRSETLSINSYYNDPLLNAAWHYQEEVSNFDGTIEWNRSDLEFKGTTPYVIANGTAHTPRFTVRDGAGNVIDPSEYTYTYRENIEAGTGYVIVRFHSLYTGAPRAWFKIYLPATTATYVENTDDGIRVTWNPVEGAAGYVIYRRAWSTTTNGWTDFSRWNNTTELSYLDGADDAHRVYAGTRYQYGVKAYFAQRFDRVSGGLIGGNVGDNYNLGIVGPLKTTVRITTRQLTKLVAGSKKITAYWNASKNFTGYQLSYATDFEFTKNVKTVKITDWKTASKQITSLSNGTLYYVRIRSYHEFEGMTYFGGWSNVLCVAPGSGQTVVPTKTRYRAICVGDNNYTSGASTLYGCINDMNAMAGMLSGLKNAFTVTKLSDGTSTQIINAIRALAKDGKDSDVTLLSFSGHGNTSGIFCVDGRVVTFSTLATELNKVPGRVIIILDCCQSGASIGKGEIELEAINTAAIEAFSALTQNARSNELAKSKFIVITAARSSEYSYDGGFDGSGYSQGAFTAALIKNMGCKYPNGERSGSTVPADKNGDKSVTLKELYDAIRATVSGWGTPQTAQYYGTDSAVLFELN